MFRERDPERKLTDFGDLFMPEQADEPILTEGVGGALLEWLTEIWAEKALAEVGLSARKRALFDGPPGVGKTTLAHHLAARLGLPMLAVRPDQIIDKWVGSTGQNIGAVFDLAAQGIADGDGGVVPVLLFMDEFDALGGRRIRADNGAEFHRNEAVDTMLQRIEQYSGFLIAATNHGRDLDPAIWRRFDIQITLDLPGQPERERILARYLKPFGLPADALAGLAEALDMASPALMRALCEGIKRQVVLGPKLVRDMARGPVFDRVLASVGPHPDAGKPRLWSHGARDKAVQLIPWPLPLAGDVGAVAVGTPAPSSANVVDLGARR